MKNRIRNIFIIIFATIFFCFFNDVNAESQIKNGWVIKDQETYYYINGELQKGITTINGQNYFLGEVSGRLCKGWVTALDGNKYYTIDGVIQTGFITINDVKYYFNENGKLYTGFLREEENEFYYKSGLKQYGITNINGKDYFLGEVSGRLCKGWVTALDGNKYYTIDGVIQKGITTISGKEYFLGEVSGRLCKGWVTALDGNKYYTVDGIIQKGIIIIDGQSYFLGEVSGRLCKGWVTELIGDKYYTVDGVIQTGIININGMEYLFDKDGKLLYGWNGYEGIDYYTIDGVIQKGITTINGQNYFLGEVSGRLCKGWVTALDGNKYYTIDGVIQTGFITINDVKYYFDENGKLYTGFLREEENEFYYKSGLKQYGITNINGKDYFLGEISGKVCKGWVTALDGNKYYTVDGIIQKGITTINGQNYFLGEVSGRLCKGWVYSLNNNTYYTNNDGIIVTGDKLIDGKWYKFDLTGKLQNGWQNIQGKTYYFYSDGTRAKYITKIAGKRYEFSSEGELQYSDIKIVLDVSYWQGNIDWYALWNSGEIDAVILRMGYSETIDSMFETYISKVKELGIPYSIYWFSYAKNGDDAYKEATKTIELFNKYSLTPSYNVYYDIEDWKYKSNPNINSNDITKDNYEQITTTYINTLSSKGIGARIYSNSNFYYNRFNYNTRNYVEWIANYSVTDRPGNYRGWQYTSKGRVTGVSTEVDLSIFYW